MSLAGLVLVVALGNIMSNPTMPQADVRHDMRALFSLRADVTCGSEIEPERYKRAWRRTAPLYGLTARGVAYPVPAALRGRGWAVSARRLSRGVAGISPDRWAVVVKRPGLAVVCTHLVSKAWTSDNATTPTRRRLWREEIAGLRAIVSRQHARGRSVVVAGDLNSPHRVRLGPRAVHLGNVYRMQAVALPAPGWSARRLGGREISTRRLFTDHPMLRRVIALEPMARVG